MRDASIVRSAEAWSAVLETELRQPVRVVLTRARKMPLSVRPSRERRGTLEVRLHHSFTAAGDEVVSAVASWIRSGRRAPRACARIDAFVAESMARLPPPAARHVLVARGTHHDLERYADEVIALELHAELGPGSALARPRVSWGRRSQSRTRRSLRLGSFDPDGRLVRIHPVLDQPDVPDWFVRYIVFHELLHAARPPVRGTDDRWVHHDREFRARERRYPDYRRALEWEKRHLTALIRSARTGDPIAIARPRPTRAPIQPLGFVQRLLFG